MRHVVLCRKSQSTPHSCVTLEYSGSTEDGASWSPVPGANSDFKSAVYQLMDRLSVKDGTTGAVTHIEPSDLPALTISQRDEASILENPPLVGKDIWALSQFMPDLDVTLLAPLHYEGLHPSETITNPEKKPNRTRFEKWSRASRGRSNRNIYGSRDLFIVRELRAAVLKLFQDATEERPQHAQETYKGFSLYPITTGSISEIWIRPAWQLVHWPDISDLHPPPKPIPTRPPELIARNERAQNVARIKRNNERINKSLGRTFNRRTQSWG